MTPASGKWAQVADSLNNREQNVGPKATVLVVEDELLVRWAITDHLQDCGFKVLGAANADEAIEALERYEGIVHLVFSDVQMPGSMDGFGLAAWVRKHRPGTAVILTSGHAQAKDVAQELCDHIGEIVRKPYDFDALVKRMERRLTAESTAA